MPDFKALFDAVPGLYLVLDPNLRVVAVTDAYAQATMIRRNDIIGMHVFDLFPDNPCDPSADGVRNLRASFNQVIQSRQPDALMVQRYDVRKPDWKVAGLRSATGAR